MFDIEFGVRVDLDKENIPLMIASQTGDVMTVYNRDQTGVGWGGGGES